MIPPSFAAPADFSLVNLKAKLTPRYIRARDNNAQVNGLMSSPPTVTLSDTGPSVSPKTQFPASPTGLADYASYMRFLGGWTVWSGSAADGRVFIRSASDPNVANPPYNTKTSTMQVVTRMHFVTDAPKFVLEVNNTYEVYRLIVATEGGLRQYSSVGGYQTDYASPEGVSFMTVDFTSAGGRARREIILECQGGAESLRGGCPGYLYIGATDTLFAPPDAGPRLILLGCSYTCGPTMIGNPATTFSGTTTSGSPTVAVANTSGLSQGQSVSGAGIPVNAYINAIPISNTSIALSANATATGTVTLTNGPITRGAGLARVMGDTLGIDDCWCDGWSGAGYAITGNDLSIRYLDACQSAYPPDLVVMDPALGLNDTSVYGALGASAYQAKVQTTLANLRAGLNKLSGGVPIVVFGAIQGTASAATTLNVETSIAAAVAALNDPRIAFVPIASLPSPWLSGTGNSVSPSGTGNADIYKVGDGTHPTIAGHLYVGRRMADSVVHALNGMT